MVSMLRFSSLLALFAALLGLAAVLPAGSARAAEAAPDSNDGHYSVGIASGTTMVLSTDSPLSTAGGRIGLTGKYYWTDRLSTQVQLGGGIIAETRYLSLGSAMLYDFPLLETAAYRLNAHLGAGLMLGMGLMGDYYTQLNAVAMTGLNLHIKQPGIEVAVNLGPALPFAYVYPEVELGIGDTYCFAGVNLRKRF